MASRASIAFGAGYAVGTAIEDLIQQYDPELDDIIGGTIEQATQNLENATGANSQGAAQENVDNAFGDTVSDSSDPDGDFGVSSEMADYEDGGVC